MSSYNSQLRQMEEVRGIHARPPMSAGELARLEAAWRDPEVSTADFLERFRLSSRKLDALRAKLGPKARGSALSPLTSRRPPRRERR
ncbi:MAG: hypothetical protein KA310_03395 [Pseudomonadales bacterium]|nr:hypothetical protein [Pseudomonadales bacterium]